MVEKFTFDKLTWAAAAPSTSTSTFAGDPRRDAAKDYLRNAVTKAYQKNRLSKRWPAIVVSRRVANSLSMINQNVYAAGIGGLTTEQIQNRDTGDSVETYYIYKVVNVRNNPLPYPTDACDPILLHYPDIEAASSINEAIPLGSFVKLKYADPSNLRGGTIVEVGGTIEIGFGNQETSWKALWLDAAVSGMPPGEFGCVRPGNPPFNPENLAGGPPTGKIGGVIVNDLMKNAWDWLKPHLPAGAKVTGGIRTQKGQDDAIVYLARNAGLQIDPADCASLDAAQKKLTDKGFFVARWVGGYGSASRGHGTGEAIDITAPKKPEHAHLYEMKAIIEQVSADPNIPVVFSPFSGNSASNPSILEKKNNAIHLGIQSAAPKETA